MTLQEYLDAIADKLLDDARTGKMPDEIKRDVQELLDRLQTEIDIYGHVQTVIAPNVLTMPFEQFRAKIIELSRRH